MIRQQAITVPLDRPIGRRGYEVSLYDEIVDPQRLIGANKAFLERELPHIASLMRSSIEEVLEQSEVVVVTNGSQTFRRSLALADENQIIIDLVGVGRNNGYKRNGNYAGICW